MLLLPAWMKLAAGSGKMKPGLKPQKVKVPRPQLGIFLLAAKIWAAFLSVPHSKLPLVGAGKLALGQGASSDGSQNLLLR